MEAMPSEERDRYPWGTRLEFEKEEIDKIPFLQTVKSDAEINIKATGFIKEVSVTDVSKKSGRRARHRIEIQIEKVGFEDKNSFKEGFEEEAEKK